jgi:hypothetical protein
VTACNGRLGARGVAGVRGSLLRNLITQELEAGEGVGVIDPHGDLAAELLDHIPPCRTDHVVYFNPADQDYPVTWLLRRPPNWWASLKKVLDWSPRQDRLTRN